MSTELIDPSKGAFASFKDRITNDIVKRSGELISDDVVSEIVSDALKKLVDDGMREASDSYPPTPDGWLRTVVREAYAEEAKRQTQAWFAANPEQFQDLIASVFALKGVEIIASGIAASSQSIAYEGARLGRDLTIQDLRNAGLKI